MDEHGAWRRAVVRRLHLGAGAGPPCLAMEVNACLQQLLGGLSLAREKATDILPESQLPAPGSILRGNLEPTPCRHRGPPVVA